MKQYSRTQRLNEQFAREIALMLQSDVKDTRIGFVTINEVEVTKDLKTAKVYYTVLGDAKSQHDSGIGLSQSAGFIRRRLGEILRLRHIPELIFIYDKGLEQGIKVLQMITDLEGK